MNLKVVQKKDSLFTIAEVASILGVSIGTLRRWEREKKITSIHTMGGHRRYNLHQIELLKLRKVKRIPIPEISPIKIIGAPVEAIIKGKPGILGRLISFVVISYSLIFIAQN